MDEEKQLFTRPIEPNTKITKQELLQIEDFKVLLESWYFDGIKAKSIIFKSTKSIKINKARIASILQKSTIPLYFTVKEAGGFIFINYNFKIY